MSSLENSTQMFKEKHQSIQSLAKMEKGILPNSFYKAIITLIQKKKKVNTEEEENYKPVSLTSID